MTFVFALVVNMLPLLVKTNVICFHSCEKLFFMKKNIFLLIGNMFPPLGKYVLQIKKCISTSRKYGSTTSKVIFLTSVKYVSATGKKGQKIKLNVSTS